VNYSVIFLLRVFFVEQSIAGPTRVNEYFLSPFSVFVCWQSGLLVSPVGLFCLACPVLSFLFGGDQLALQVIKLILWVFGKS
jgi:hypothetical protein